MTLNKVASWNVKVNRPNKDVTDGVKKVMDNTGAKVICLQEASKYIGALKDRFGEHWFVYHTSGWDEAADDPVLVHRSMRDKHGAEDQAWGTLRYTTKWTGPQGGVHQGRTWTWVKVGGLLVMSFHRCTGGKDQNADAFKVEHDKVVDFIKAQDMDVLVFGDHNCGAKADFKGSSFRIAEHVGGKTRDDGGVDYAITRGCGGSVRDTDKMYVSDHSAVVWTRT